MTPSLFNIRFIAVCCLTFSFIMHSAFMKWGLRLQNVLGFFKLFVLLAISMIGMFHLLGVPGFKLQEGVETPHNLEWSTLWEGSGNGATAFVTGLYNVIWCVHKNMCAPLARSKSPLLLGRSSDIQMRTMHCRKFEIRSRLSRRLHHWLC
jgi:Amino acid permease